MPAFFFAVKISIAQYNCSAQKFMRPLSISSKYPPKCCRPSGVAVPIFTSLCSVSRWASQKIKSATVGRDPTFGLHNPARSCLRDNNFIALPHCQGLDQETQILQAYCQADMMTNTWSMTNSLISPLIFIGN